MSWMKKHREITRLILSSWLFSSVAAFGTFRLHVAHQKTSVYNSHDAFDFSSTAEWDNFYQENDTFEWHSSISLETIASFVHPNSDCLMVGCGNSNLPRVVLKACEKPRIVLLDTSPTCLEQLEKEYGSLLGYQCGDASKLESYFQQESFDLIVDKGLTDALLCGEGWDGPLASLIHGASKVLRSGSGEYLLISYKLGSSTKDVLTDAGALVGIEWDFDLASSTDRVSVSIGRKI